MDQNPTTDPHGTNGFRRQLAYGLELATITRLTRLQASRNRRGQYHDSGHRPHKVRTWSRSADGSLSPSCWGSLYLVPSSSAVPVLRMRSCLSFRARPCVTRIGSSGASDIA